MMAIHILRSWKRMLRFCMALLNTSMRIVAIAFLFSTQGLSNLVRVKLQITVEYLVDGCSV